MGSNKSKPSTNEDQCILYHGTWVNSENGEIPYGAVVGGYDYKGTSDRKEDEFKTYIGRTTVGNKGVPNILPGKVDPNENCCYVANYGNEYKSKGYQILVNRQKGVTFEWVPASNGYIVDGAVVGGYDGDEIIFIARQMHAGKYYTALVSGKLQPSYKSCKLPFNGAGQTYYEYEILVKRPLCTSEDQCRVVTIETSSSDADLKGNSYFFAEATHPSGFSPVENEDQILIINELISMLEYTGATGLNRAGTLIKAGDDAFIRRLREHNQNSLARRIENNAVLRSIRIDLQGFDSQPSRHERLSIQIESRTIGTIHIPRGVDYINSGGRRIIRQAFFQSIQERQEIWLPNIREPQNRNLTYAQIIASVLVAGLTWEAYIAKWRKH